jgi:hypothetical protein
VGSPWLMMVDSNATTAAPDEIASVTSLVQMRSLGVTGRFCPRFWEKLSAGGLSG